MVFKFELLVQTVDFPGRKREWEFIVVAKDDGERDEELASAMNLHDEVKSWSIREIRSCNELDVNSPFFTDYLDKGAHSYYS